MFEYQKTILQKVSFDEGLFRRELRKTLDWIHQDEIPALHSWCMMSFGDKYAKIISEEFHLELAS